MARRRARRRPARHDDPVRRTLLPIAALALAAVLAGPAWSAPVDAASATVHTVVGPGTLAAPAGIALDAAGDVFVADSGHCRVVLLPSHTSTRYGLHLHAGRVVMLAGGRCTGAGTLGYPTGVAVDGQGDVYVAEPTVQRVQVVHPNGTVATVAGTGRPGFDGDGLSATDAELNQPTAIALDGAGDLFIADTANCRVRVMPAKEITLFGHAMAAGHLYTVAGTGVCGTTGQGGPVGQAELWNPVAVTVDAAGDLLVADSGDQSVLLASARGGTYYGTAVGAGDIGVVVGGTGTYGPYLTDGLPATSPAAEVNDPRGLAVGPTGALFLTDGFMHVIRAVPATSGTLLGRSMTGGDLYTVAGALPVSTPEGPGDGTRWVLTRVGTPSGLAVTASGSVYFSDAALDQLRVIR
jgi:sugar lactone lactonase YvrE